MLELPVDECEQSATENGRRLIGIDPACAPYGDAVRLDAIDMRSWAQVPRPPGPQLSACVMAVVRPATV
jgi:hypothetical protein